MQHITQQMYTLSDSRVTRAARVRATEKHNDTTQNTPPVKHDDTAVSSVLTRRFNSQQAKEQANILNTRTLKIHTHSLLHEFCI